MFNIFSKKEQKKEEEKPLADKLGDEDLDKDVTIHTMPERFRGAHLVVTSAKKTGALILILGALVLVAMVAGAYYFIFRRSVVTPQNQVSQENISTTTQEEKGAKENAPATTTNVLIEEATTTMATSTIATTSPEESSPSTEEVPTTIISLKPGADQDGDGLSDLEEALLGTNETITDTDNDGYNDLTELLNFYNPAGDGKLSANPLMREYKNKTYKYSLLYPTAWEAGAIGGDDSVIFRSPDNQFIQAIVQPNLKKQTIDEWFGEQFNTSTISEERKIAGQNWQAVTSEDGMVVYITDRTLKNIYTLTYTTGESDKLEYINIFKAMVKNLEIY